MSLELLFKNELGEVLMSGDGSKEIRVLKMEGFGPAMHEYNAAVYSGYNGQETIFQKVAARTLTLSVEINGKNMRQLAHKIAMVLSSKGILYIKTDNFHRRIECNQVQIPDMEGVLKGQIATFAVQMVCDSPYFEDAEDTSVPLYIRTKLLDSPFTLPTMFGEIVLGASVEVLGVPSVEPEIKLYYPTALLDVETITVVNETTGKFIKLNYAPQPEETVTIDVKKRKITGSVRGNLINYLSDDTFLGDFVLKRGINVLTVEIGDVSADFKIGCKYNNLYLEAMAL